MYECAHSFITYNNLNIPSYDVHSIEARDQMLVNLYKLQESFVKINNTMLDKNKDQNERIQKIRARITSCVQRIQELEGINKAICFVSPGEYPTKYVFDPKKNASIFKEFIERTQVNKFDLQAHYQMKHEIEKVGESSKLELDNLYKFVLYLYGKLKCKKMTALESGIAQKKVRTNNLGRIPNTIRYVDSLAIFDTSINPYKNYEIAPKSKPSKPKPRQEQPQAQPEIVSITNYVKPTYDIENPNYKPKTQEVDNIIVDDDLPLDGVVDIDLDDFLEGMTPNRGVVEKRVIEDPYKQKEGQRVQSQVGVTEPANTYAQGSKSSILPPPPSLSSTLSSPPSFDLPPPPPLLSSLSMPPPPPPISELLPPPVLLGPPLILDLPAPTLSPPTPVSGGGGISDLLKQLQNPNPMARLKKVVTKQTPNIPTETRPGSTAGPGALDSGARPLSLMEALQLKIKNRFKALHPEQEQQD